MRKGDFFNRVELNNLYRYGCALCANQDDAYDLLQYALEKYLLKSETRNRASDMAYVRTTMRNYFIDMYRKSVRFPEEEYDDSLVVIDETALEDIVIAQCDLEIAWKELNAMEREVLYYWAIEGMTALEIANQIDAPRGTILSRLYRIRKKLNTEAENNNLSGGRAT